MATFYNQPLVHRFGTQLIDQLATGRWESLEVSVAWVRQSGMKHLKGPFGKFLRSGGMLAVTTGLDLHGTSVEGLEALLELEAAGNAQSYVNHNQAKHIFHPKIYLWLAPDRARLVVASNNLTEAGLFLNTEAGLEINAPPEDSLIKEVANAMSSWRDVGSGLAKRLTRPLLAKLLQQDYVRHERDIRIEESAREPGRTARTRGSPLFGRRSVSPPAVEGEYRVPRRRAIPAGSVRERAARAGEALQGKVLLMRVRKAHVVDRPTQTQIPKAVYETDFFAGIDRITSGHDDQSHRVIEAAARGIVNTLKMEVPEMRTFDDPVLRFERTASGVVYEAYDATSSQGQQIMSTLRAGLGDAARPTRLTLPQDPEAATWWRFI